MIHSSRFDELLQSHSNTELHKTLHKWCAAGPLDQLPNLILYGPNMENKYIQMLKCISHFSPTQLKYHKKISVTCTNKQTIRFPISDIHYEVDMSLLGCSSRTLWHDIYLQFIESISAKPGRAGIIVCTNFHEINNDLLSDFYSYIQKSNASSSFSSRSSSPSIIFILLTNQLGFIPETILKGCCSIPIPCTPSLVPCPFVPHAVICNKIVTAMCSANQLPPLTFREIVYDLFVYNLNIYESIWTILKTLQSMNKLKWDVTIWSDTYRLFADYHRHYHTMFHVERYLYFLMDQMKKVNLNENNAN